MNRERFEYLFQQYKTDRLSREEWEVLRQAIQEGSCDDWLEADLRKQLLSGDIHETWNPELASAMWQEILLADAQQAPVVSPQPGRSRSQGQPEHSRSPRPRSIRPFIRYTAIAASILAVIVLGWFFPIHTGHGHADIAAARPVGNTIHPGEDKAMLILADGTRIALDSTQNGQIASLGSTRILKLNGTLSLSPAGGFSSPSPSTSYNTITTPRGGQFQIVLPDGSKVWLNSASSLQFPAVFKGGERRVIMTGEAYFEIARNKDMPFTVSIASPINPASTGPGAPHGSAPAPGGDLGQVRVLGTNFNVMAYPEEQTVNTTLLQGAVEVSGAQYTRRLAPGQQAALDNAHHKLSVGQVDVDQSIAWKNGLFEFDHTDLATIMRQLARWYDIEVVYRVPPDKTPLGGSISRNLNLKEVLSLLEANGINHFKIDNKKVFVLP
jgi:ferric-dicitrate binding protein FerR (iron transport regulator)